MNKKIVYLAIAFPLLILITLALFGSKTSSTGNGLDNNSSYDKVDESKLLTKPQSSPEKMAETTNQGLEGMPKTMQKPEMELKQNTAYEAFIKTTEGVIKIELNAEETPKTVNNFVYLSRAGFYDNTIFHRIIKGFMIQGGDPTGTGAGGPGYSFEDEPFTGDYLRGTIAMANAGPNTNGSQFFIMHEGQKLPKNYVIFGTVAEGIEVVDEIATQAVQANQQGELSKPINPTKILNVEIIEKSKEVR